MNSDNNNHKTVAQVARDVVDEYGADALRILRERAELADAQGDRLAGDAWRDIGVAAEHLLRDDQG